MRTAPSVDADVVGQVQIGNVLRLAGERGDWFIVYLFAGEERFAHITLGKPIEEISRDPESRTRDDRFTKHSAEQRRDRTARGIGNRLDVYAEVAHRRLLFDRYGFGIARTADFSPIYWNRSSGKGRSRACDDDCPHYHLRGGAVRRHR